MKYKESLALSFKFYPTLYEKEEDVLHQYFFVNGNGLSWFEGELVELKYDRHTGDAWPYTLEELEARNVRDKESLKRQRQEMRQSMKALFPEDYAGRTDDDDSWMDPETPEEIAAYHKKHKELFASFMGIEEYEAERRKLYPLCEYARILHLPDNIKPDWLDAAERAIAWAESPEVVTTDSDKEFLVKAKERILEIKSNR